MKLGVEEGEKIIQHWEIKYDRIVAQKQILDFLVTEHDAGSFDPKLTRKLDRDICKKLHDLLGKMGMVEAELRYMRCDIKTLEEIIKAMVKRGRELEMEDEARWRVFECETPLRRRHSMMF